MGCWPSNCRLWALLQRDLLRGPAALRDLTTDDTVSKKQLTAHTLNMKHLWWTWPGWTPGSVMTQCGNPAQKRVLTIRAVRNVSAEVTHRGHVKSNKQTCSEEMERWRDDPRRLWEALWQHAVAATQAVTQRSWLGPFPHQSGYCGGSLSPT